MSRKRQAVTAEGTPLLPLHLCWPRDLDRARRTELDAWLADRGIDNKDIHRIQEVRRVSFRAHNLPLDSLNRFRAQRDGLEAWRASQPP